MLRSGVELASEKRCIDLPVAIGVKVQVCGIVHHSAGILKSSDELRTASISVKTFFPHCCKRLPRCLRRVGLPCRSTRECTVEYNWSKCQLIAHRARLVRRCAEQLKSTPYIVEGCGRVTSLRIGENTFNCFVCGVSQVDACAEVTSGQPRTSHGCLRSNESGSTSVIVDDVIKLE